MSDQVRVLRIRACRNDLLRFAKAYLRHRFPLSRSTMHRDFAKDANALDSAQPLRLAMAAPDGYGKSSLVTFALVLWCLAYQKRRCIVIGSSTRQVAGEHLAGIDHELRTNDRLIADFPHLSRVGRTSGASGSRASPPRLLSIPGVGRVQTIGPSSHITGVNFEGGRPDLFVLDEFDGGILGSNDAWKLDGTDSATSRMVRAIESRILHRYTDASVVVTSPLLASGCLIDRLLEPKQTMRWTQRFYPAVLKYPDRFDLWFEWARLATSKPQTAATFADQHGSIMMKGAQVLWPEHESFERLMQLRFEHGWEWFDAFRQGRPVGGSLRTRHLSTPAVLISIGTDAENQSEDLESFVIDDAGYRRPVAATRDRTPVRIVIRDEMRRLEGDPLPAAASGPVDGLVF